MHGFNQPFPLSLTYTRCKGVAGGFDEGGGGASGGIHRKHPGSGPVVSELITVDIFQEGEKPGFNIAPCAQTPHPAEGSDAGLLNQVFGIVPVARDSHRVPVQPIDKVQ